MNSPSRDLSPNTSAVRPSAHPQVLHCEHCDAEATADDWIAGLSAVICPTCLEHLMDAQTLEQQP